MIIKNDSKILTLEEWARYAGPKSSIQWVDDRSAKEAARAWLEQLGSGLPVEVANTLASHDAFGPIQKWVAEPEAQLPFDSFPGEPRNSDLVVYAQDAFGPFLIAVEAKADEPFAETVADTLASSVERRLVNGRSNGIDRVQQLATALFGPRQGKEPSLNNIRYQLLTATAGALCEAERRKMNRAILLIHEFVTNKTADEKHDANAKDLDHFIHRLSRGGVTAVQSGHLYGPFTVPGFPLVSADIKLFVGKATRRLRTK